MRTTEPINESGSKLLRFMYNTAVGRILMKPLLFRPVSFVGGKFLNSGASRPLIKKFIIKNGIDMSDYVSDGFSSFNSFFIRKTLEGKRPVCRDSGTLVSPCDARLTAYLINDDSVFTVKGVEYTVNELLKDKALASRFSGGNILIFRLAVDNYHRYGWCADGTFGKTVHIKGMYHTVQPIAMRSNKIFRENTREFTLLESRDFGDIVQMEVGALMVGRISNSVTDGGSAIKGEEKGKFEFGGSTVIVITQKDKVEFDPEFFSNTEKHLETLVKYGEKIGTAAG